MPTHPELGGPIGRRQVSLKTRERPAETPTIGCAFGLPLEIDPGIDLPGLIARSAHDETQARAPTRVRLDPGALRLQWDPVASEAETVRELRDGSRVLFTVKHASETGWLFDAPGIGSILITPDGEELICSPHDDSELWPSLLPAQALPLAATVRGLELLHASAVAIDGRAALFTGPPGAGKSSLAAALLRAGAPLLSDDAVAIEQVDGTLIVHPSVALINLRAAEQQRLSSAERSLLGSASAFLDKQRYRCAELAPSTPFGALFLLERGEGMQIEPVEAIDPFALLASTFNLSVRTPARLARNLNLVTALAGTGSIYKLRVQEGIGADVLAAAVSDRLSASEAKAKPGQMYTS